jgi:hypothetical protein
MGATSEHGQLIAAAAKAALVPLGCQRVGRSRTWISDQRFWLIQIEFQPSGWSKGSYLNVGAAWLWRATKGLAFDYGDRIANFVPFESSEQFAPLIAGHAARAAQEVVALREKFRSMPDVYRNLMARDSRDGWPVYHAAVAAGLVGDTSAARRLLARVETWNASFDGQPRLKSDSAELASILDDPERAPGQPCSGEVRSLCRLAGRPFCQIARRKSLGREWCRPL